LDAKTFELISWASPAIVHEFLQAGKLKTVGTKRQVRQLLWIGPPISLARQTPAQIEREDYKPADWKQTKYSHNHETRDNPEKVWTLTSVGRDFWIYHEALWDCLSEELKPAAR
jgi:hypothetical protein